MHVQDDKSNHQTLLMNTLDVQKIVVDVSAKPSKFEP